MTDDKGMEIDRMAVDIVDGLHSTIAALQSRVEELERDKSGPDPRDAELARLRVLAEDNASAGVRFMLRAEAAERQLAAKSIDLERLNRDLDRTQQRAEAAEAKCARLQAGWDAAALFASQQAVAANKAEAQLAIAQAAIEKIPRYKPVHVVEYGQNHYGKMDTDPNGHWIMRSVALAALTPATDKEAQV